MSDEATRPDPYQALRYREYRWFLLGNLALTTATQIQTAVILWQVYALTRSKLALGYVGLAEALPFLAVTLYGGHLADQLERRKICFWSQLVLVASAAGLFWLNRGEGIHSVAVLYAFQALGGLARAFYRPAYQALASELVPRESYANASTWRSGMFHIAIVAGPALGGLLIRYGYPVAYGAELVLMALGMAYFPVLRPRPLRPASVDQGAWARLKEGLRFIRGQKVVLSALSLDLFAVLFGGAPALLVVFAKDILGVGEVGYGWLRSAPALGSIVMSFLLAHRAITSGAGRKLLWCVAAFGLCWIAFAFSRSFWLSMTLLALSGAFDNVSVILRATLVQTFTPPELMGRVSAVNSFFIGSSNEVGAFESGVMAKALGTVPSVVFGGCMTLLTVAVTAWKAPQLRKLEKV